MAKPAASCGFAASKAFPASSKIVVHLAAYSPIGRRVSCRCRNAVLHCRNNLRRLACVSLPIFNNGRIRILDRRARTIDLVSAALVCQAILFCAETLPADWANKILLRHRSSLSFDGEDREGVGSLTHLETDSNGQRNHTSGNASGGGILVAGFREQASITDSPT